MARPVCGRSRRCVVAALVMVAVVGCGDETPMAPGSLTPEGVWLLEDAGVRETTVRLTDDGSFSRVVADLVGQTCVSSSGRWRVTGDVLTLTVTTRANQPVSESEQYGLAVQASELLLDGGAAPGRYVRGTSMVSCVDYAFGSWIGVLSAEVDGVELAFQVGAVDLDVDRGELAVDGSHDERLLSLRVDGSPGPLDARTFTVQNVPGASDTFYGLYHPDPASTVFSGFDTTRLSPTGSLTLTSIAPERIVATFSFRANPRIEGEEGPNGEMFALIETGRIDLEYR